MFGLLILLGHQVGAHIDVRLDGHFRQVSVGVYDRSGDLVRTLVRCADWGSGLHQVPWDGAADDGRPATDGPFSAKVLAGNLGGEWAGALYDGSKFGASTYTLQGYGGILGFQAAGRDMLLERSYNESPEYFDRFSNVSPNVYRPSGRTISDPLGFSYIPTCVTSDGATVYAGFAPSGINAPRYNNAGVFAYPVREGEPLKWSVAQPIAGTLAGQNDDGHLLLLRDGTGAPAEPTSLSVQAVGPALAVAQRSLGRVAFHDKSSGAVFSWPALVVPQVTCVRWAKNDRTLWVAADASVREWQLGARGWSPLHELKGPDVVWAMAVDPATGNLAVAYGGRSQQVLLYSSSGRLLKTLGVAGGYATGPEVNDFKWSFSDSGFNTGYGEGLAFDADGKLWINDPGNYRAVRVNLKAGWVDARISHISAQYCLTVDPNQSSRLFVGWLEFERNWLVPPEKPNAYRLVRNWGYGQPQGGHNGFLQVVTGANGRTYGVAHYGVGQPEKRMWELRSTGLRQVSDNFPYEFLDQKMDVWWSSADRAVGQVSRAPFAGFDASNDPTWGPAEIYARPPHLTGDPFSEGGVPGADSQAWQTTRDGSLICVSHAVNAPPRQWFLGLVPHGGSSYGVRAAPGDVSIPLPSPREARVPAGGSYTIAGAKSLGDLIWILVGGEGWSSGEACQTLLYHACGLPVWQGGVTNLPGLTYTGGNGRAGNPYGNAVARDSAGVVHLVTTAEAASGPQEWTFEGVDTVQVVAVPFIDGVAKVEISGGGKDKESTPKPRFEDTFRRADSATVGREWEDENRQWAIIGGRAVQRTPNFSNYRKTLLLRPGKLANTVQELTLPDSINRVGELWSNGTIQFGAWGLVARKQVDGSFYYAQLRYEDNSKANTYSIRFSIGLFDAVGTQWTISADQQITAPVHGHRYAIRFDVHGLGLTHLSAELVDLTLGKVWMHVDGVSDQPELQAAGQVGLFSGWQHNPVTAYRLFFASAATR